MRIWIKTALFPLIWAGFASVSFAALANVTHVSINQQQFVLGAYPKLKVNIVAENIHLDKVQFILSQRGGTERLMVRPLNSYLLELTGIEDVTDPGAQLIVKEYRINQWVDVKRIALFDGQSADLSQAAATVRGQVASKTGVMPDSSPSESGKSAVGLVEVDCQLDRQGGQTLWRLASQYSGQWNLTPYGAMLAIFDANPKAFNRGDIHGLRADVRLNCPSSEVKRRYLDPQLAKQRFEAM